MIGWLVSSTNPWCALEAEGFKISLSAESPIIFLYNQSVDRNEVADITGVEPAMTLRMGGCLRIDFPAQLSTTAKAGA